MTECVNCVNRVIYAKGRCRACYDYLWRTGRDRDEAQAVARAQRRFERAIYRKRIREILLSMGDEIA